MTKHVTWYPLSILLLRVTSARTDPSHFYITAVFELVSSLDKIFHRIYMSVYTEVFCRRVFVCTHCRETASHGRNPEGSYIYIYIYYDKQIEAFSLYSNQKSALCSSDTNCFVWRTHYIGMSVSHSVRESMHQLRVLILQYAHESSLPSSCGCIIHIHTYNI